MKENKGKRDAPNVVLLLIFVLNMIIFAQNILLWYYSLQLILINALNQQTI